MDGSDFLGEDVSHIVQRYEKMLRNKKSEYFEPEDIEAIANYYLGTEKEKKALEAVNFGLELYPNNILLWTKKAEVYTAQEKFELSISILEKAESMEPLNPEIALLKGENSLALGDESEAVTCFEKALRYADDQIDMQFEIAYIYQDYEYFGKAAWWLEQIIEQQPDLEQAIYEAANCYDIIGKYDKAEALLDDLINRDPYNATAWYNISLIRTKKGNHEEAIQAVELCLAIEEDYSIAWFIKGNSLIELEKFEEAIAAFEEAMRHEGEDFITYCNIGGCYERLQNYKESKENYRKAAKLNPNFGEAWFGIALCYTRENQPREALQYYRRAALLEPENAEYQLGLASAEYGMGNLNEAERIYEKLCEKEPAMNEAWLDRSLIYHQEGNTAKAIEILKDALEIDRNSARYHFRLCAYLYSLGKKQEAFAALEHGLVLDILEAKGMLDFMPELRDAKDITNIIKSYIDKFPGPY